jgi:hypothetical protein
VPSPSAPIAAPILGNWRRAPPTDTSESGHTDIPGLCGP